MNLQNLLDYDQTLLDGVDVPAPLSKELTQSTIVMRCGLLTPLYSEAATMKTLIALWFNTHQWNLEHLLAIVEAEYSPIENTDKYDNWTRTIDTDRTGSNQNTRLDTGTYSGSETGRTDTENAGTSSGNRTEVTDGEGTENTGTTANTTGQTDTTASSETEHTVSAFNANTYQPDSKDTASSTGTEQTQTATTGSEAKTTTDDITVTVTESGNTSGTGSEERTNATSGQHNDSITDTGNTAGTEDTTETYTQHQHGNIGVITNQQMITEEITLVKMFNIYDQIAAMLETDLFLGVY